MPDGKIEPDAVLELTEDGTVELTDTGDKHDVDRIAGRDVTVLGGSDVPPRFEHEEVYRRYKATATGLEWYA